MWLVLPHYSSLSSEVIPSEAFAVTVPGVAPALPTTAVCCWPPSFARFSASHRLGVPAASLGF